VRKRATPPRTPSPLELWSTLEADDSELIAHVDRRLGRSTSEPPLPGEPAWLAEAVEAAWPRLLRDADRDARP
jgi:hypothetical protein